MGQLGETLRQARLDRAASLVDAEQETHIRRRYLEALENEDYTALPAQVYTRGFIRTYARYLGLDVESTLDLYLPGRTREERPAIRSATPAFQAGRPLPIRLLTGVAGALLVLLLLSYIWTQYNSFRESLNQGDATAGRVTPTPARAAPVASPAAVVPSPSPTAPAVAPVPPVQPTPDRGVVLELRVTERSWVEVWVDGASQLAQPMPSGATRSFQANQIIRLRVGNAGGVQVTVNGEPKGALGERNQVKEIVWER